MQFLIDSLELTCYTVFMFDAKELQQAILFLKTEYPAKDFLLAAGVHNPTMHQWAKRGYFYFNNPGRGNTLFLTGRNILHLACLNLISKASGSLKIHLKGLEECLIDYCHELITCTCRSYKTYCCLRFVLDSIEGYEWALTENPLDRTRIHVVEAFGQKAEPYFSAIDLDELLKKLTLKLK